MLEDYGILADNEPTMFFAGVSFCYQDIYLSIYNNIF